MEKESQLKKNIYLVDDHPLVTEWLTQLINSEQDLHICGNSSNAQDALEKMQEYRPDLAIVDLTLKESSGLDLIMSVKKNIPHILIIVLSMHEETAYVERSLHAGAKGYVIKRETSDQIILAIRKVLNGGVYLSGDLAFALAEGLVQKAETGLEKVVDLLSPREIETFSLLGQGKTTSQIAEILGINLKTIHSYCGRIKEKLHLSNSTELIRAAVCWYEEEKKLKI